MILIYILANALALYGISIKRHGFIDEPLDIRISHSINGIFIILVFCRHIFQYIYPSVTEPNILDSMGGKVDGHLYQLLVVPFLFFSGYGLTVSAERRGGGYVDNIPKNRCLTVWLNFMVGVCFFALLQIALGNEFAIKKFALSLICWDSLGNSNWYIFCILWCYLFSYVAYKLSKKKTTFLAIVWILSFTYIAVLYKFKGDWWYNTILAYPTGVTFTVYRESIISAIKRHWFIAMMSSFIVFALGYVFMTVHGNPVVHNVVSVLMCILMIIVMMKVRVHNKYLEWMGKNLFPLYIYMRIPMILLSQDTVIVHNHETLYVMMCFIITLLFGYLYRFFKLSIK